MISDRKKKRKEKKRQKILQWCVMIKPNTGARGLGEARRLGHTAICS